MSTVVNGHRDEGGSGGHGSHPRPRPPHGHILPTLSFSASTPTDEDNPLEVALQIDSPLYEEPENDLESSSFGRPRDDDEDDETTPLMASSRSVMMVDGERDDDEGEREPLLSRTSAGGGGGGGGGGNRGLALPLNTMARRASCHTYPGVLENGDPQDSLQDTINSFIHSRPPHSATLPITTMFSGHDVGREDETLLGQAATTTTTTATTTDEELLNVANQFVEEILTKAQQEACRKTKGGGEAGSTEAERLLRDERMMEVVRGFVSDIMVRAKKEAYDSMVRQVHNNNNLVMGKEGGVSGSSIHPGGAPTLMSPGSGTGGRFWRRGPWYVQMGRVFTAFLSRICPCRCPTKP